MATSQAGAQTLGKQSHSSVEAAFDKAMRDWIAKHKGAPQGLCAKQR
jgi:hypothetical protein